MKTPQYLLDIYKYVESIPFGTIEMKIKRVNKQTVELEQVGQETLKYVDNDEALRDLTNMFNSLIENGYNGETHVKLTQKDGDIQLVGIFNKEQAKY